MFSPLEKQIIKILKRRKTPASIKSIAKRVDSKSKTPHISVANAIHRINHKCNNSYQINWYINGEGFGCLGRDVWIDFKLDRWF